MTALKWWGYKHENGEYQVKRYWDEEDFRECKKECSESPFVTAYTNSPFEATHREDALMKIREIL